VFSVMLAEFFVANFVERSYKRVLRQASVQLIGGIAAEAVRYPTTNRRRCAAGQDPRRGGTPGGLQHWSLQFRACWRRSECVKPVDQNRLMPSVPRRIRHFSAGHRAQVTVRTYDGSQRTIAIRHLLRQVRNSASEVLHNPNPDRAILIKKGENKRR
jgi:hypothetical protein